MTALRPVRVPGTAVFMTAQPTGTPPALAHNLRYNKVLHQHVIVLTVTTAQQPHVAPEERISVEPLGHDLFNVRLQYGFMEDPDVPEALIRRGRKAWNSIRRISPISWAEKPSSSPAGRAWRCGARSCSW